MLPPPQLISAPPNDADFKYALRTTKSPEKIEASKYNKQNTSHIEVDGRVITRQNYLFSALVAEKAIEKLEESELFPDR